MLVPYLLPYFRHLAIGVRSGISCGVSASPWTADSHHEHAVSGRDYALTRRAARVRAIGHIEKIVRQRAVRVSIFSATTTH